MSAVKCTCDESYCSPYYEPAHWGLEIVGVVECDLSYEFDMFVIWTDGHRYYWASDAGCSCPVPFEDTELLEGTARDALIDLEAWAEEDDGWGSSRERREAYEEAARSDWFAALTEVR